MPIERANSADAAIPRFAQFLGPPLAGVLIVVVGASNVLLVDAATFAFSALLVAVAVPSTTRATEGMSPQNSPGYFAQLLEGIRFVRGNVLILSMILVATVANLMDTPLVSVILPVYAKTVYDSAVSLGVMLGAFGAGALVGTVLFGVVGHRLPRRLTFILCFVAAPALGYLTLAAMPPLAILVGAFALGGLIGGPINPLYSTVTQEHTPREIRGRVFGVLTALAMCGIPLGAALGGFMVERVGLRPTVLVMGAVYLVVTLSMFFNPAMREMDATKERSAS